MVRAQGTGGLPVMADSTEADVVGKGGDLLAYDLKELRWEMLPITPHLRRIALLGIHQSELRARGESRTVYGSGVLSVTSVYFWIQQDWNKKVSC